MGNNRVSGELVAAAVVGYENLASWSELLDRINVFPVADGDTGVNLRVSLAPLRGCRVDLDTVLEQLSLSGRGNSGNIAVAFFREFLKFMEDGLAEAVCRGRDMAWHAIVNPTPGTMLEVFDALCLTLAEEQEDDSRYLTIRDCLQKAVLGTETQLPELSDAGVVDAGALGMFCFFDGFFRELLDVRDNVCKLTDLFGDALCVNTSFHPSSSDEFCVEAYLRTGRETGTLFARLESLGNSVVAVPDKSGLKLHVHTRNPARLKKELSQLGEVDGWRDESMEPATGANTRKRFLKNKVRIMSDAAGSIPLTLARTSGIILLDSYIVARDLMKPESLFSPEQLYALMKCGIRVTTAQASNRERHFHYQAAIQQYEKVLYLCTGSAFTGNYSVAVGWQKTNASNGQFTVVDTGAASGRLAVIALLAARLAETGAEAKEVNEYVEVLSRQAEEFVFIHELKYLVAGGRLSKTKGFLGDFFHKKPVITPWFSGVRKRGMVRTPEAQLDFACAALKNRVGDAADMLVVLQHTDNRKWLEQVVEEKISKQLPGAEILLLPLSLTSGVHMGPGTWSIAFASSQV